MRQLPQTRRQKKGGAKTKPKVRTLIVTVKVEMVRHGRQGFEFVVHDYAIPSRWTSSIFEIADGEHLRLLLRWMRKHGIDQPLQAIPLLLPRHFRQAFKRGCEELMVLNLKGVSHE
jgi:hypothetical protein